MHVENARHAGHSHLTEDVAGAVGQSQLTEGHILRQKLETKLSEAGDSGNESMGFYFGTRMGWETKI